MLFNFNHAVGKGTNTLGHEQNCRHFAGMFKYIMSDENLPILSELTLKFVPEVIINNVPSLV